MFIALLWIPITARAADDSFEARTWTDRKGRQLTSTFVDARNGEVQLKNDAGEIQKFKLADFSEPDQKYLRDLANYRRKLAAGEKPPLPSDPATASLKIQPLQSDDVALPNAPGFRKPLLDFPIRIWTDTVGKKIQGKLVTAYSDKVVIDVKGNLFDISITRLSGDDQQYVAIQLKGLQRDDLVNSLASAVASPIPPDGAAPPPTMAAVAPPPTTSPASDDIQTRLAQLKSQLAGPTRTADPAADSPQANGEDLQERLARINKLKREMPAPAPEAPVTQPVREIPLASAPPPVVIPQGHAFEPPPTPSEPMFRMGKQCMSCKKEVPGHLTAGDKCPHCGIYFGKDMTNGKTASAPWSAKSISGLVTLGVFVLAGIGKLISKLSGN